MSLKETANAVLRLLDAGSYQVGDQEIRIEAEQAAAVNGTRLYTPEELANLGKASGGLPKVRVTDGTTQSVALELASSVDGNVALLNFASARNPGGGFLNGAKAQEEDLCRCSGL